MTHSFDTDIAEKVGVNAAIIYQNICFWVDKNIANGTNFYDGSYWTYNSIRAWKDLFPYLGEKAIRSALQRLEDEGLIMSGNYNQSAYDRTKWYSPLRKIHLPKGANGKSQKGEPIPDNKPDNKPVIKPKQQKKEFSFNLNQKTTIDKTSAEYKVRLKKAIDSFLAELEEKAIKMQVDMPPIIDYEDFMLTLEAQGYKYKNFWAAYKKWHYKGVEDARRKTA